jgi:acyl-coenzyme A synthetase/AMP-(fatty) acid ligase
MIPSRISFLAELPLTGNGKIDREKLRQGADSLQKSADEDKAG